MLLNNGPIRIGNRVNGGGEAFNGLVDELSLYNRPLTQPEIATIYNAGSAGKCTPEASPTPTATATATATFTPTPTATATATSTATATPTPTPTPTCPTIILSPPNLPNGTVGISYSRTITASGGTSPYLFQVVSGSLPPLLTLNPNTGVLSGTPTSFGSFTFVIRATD